MRLTRDPAYFPPGVGHLDEHACLAYPSDL